MWIEITLEQTKLIEAEIYRLENHLQELRRKQKNKIYVSGWEVIGTEDTLSNLKLIVANGKLEID